MSVRCANKSFSRTPVDMTLQKTINAAAEKNKTGIVVTQCTKKRDSYKIGTQCHCRKSFAAGRFEVNI